MQKSRGDKSKTGNTQTTSPVRRTGVEKLETVVIKEKLLALRQRCSEVSSEQSAVNALQCNDRLLTDSACTKMTLMLGRLESSP